MRHSTILGVLVFLAIGCCLGSHSLAVEDLRDLRTGSMIPDESYCDQPYIVIAKDGNWLCTLTTGAGKEGVGGQHVASTISTDKGKTWSKLVDIEPSSGPEASWAVPLIVPSGRVYAFYNYNAERVHSLPKGETCTDVRSANKPPIRADMFGWYCFRYSDDNGRSWSTDRYRLPVRLTACDQTNQWKGKVQVFWGIDKPKVVDGSVFFAFTKLGRYMLENGEGWIFRSDNILTEANPNKLNWINFPDGEHGIRAAEFGSVQEEHNMVPLGGGRLYCVYRTTTGYPCHAYSSDGGHTWTKPEHMTYTPGGQKIKNPRACPKLWRTADGRFLFWFHNHSGKDFEGRNPVWITGGVEKNGMLYWSQPEILLYDRKEKTRMSYPDLVEQDGRYWVTETQKSDARVHEIDKSLLEGLWNQGDLCKVARDGLILEWKADATPAAKPAVPQAIDLAKSGGLTLDCWIQLNDLKAGQVLLKSHHAQGRGISVTTAKGGAVRLELGEGKKKAAWDSDPGALQAGKLHHMVAIADAGPKIISFVVDGILCDGGEFRECGWGRWQGELGAVADAGPLTVDPSVKALRIYDRYLRTSEAVGNFHAGIR